MSPKPRLRPATLAAKQMGGDITGIAQVLLPLALPFSTRSIYSYKLLSTLNAEPAVGKRVLVPLGKSKYYAGVITELLPPTPEAHALKPVEEVLDAVPVVPQRLLQLYSWMGAYYLCSAGEVLKASLPSGLKLASETVIEAVFTNSEDIPKDVDDRTYLLLEALTLSPRLGLAQAAEIMGVKNAKKYIDELQQRGLLRVTQQLEENYRPRTRRRILLTAAYQTEAQLNAAFDAVKRAPRQEAVLLLLAEAHLKQQHLWQSEIEVRMGDAAAPIRALVQRGMVQIEDVQVDRQDHTTATPTAQVTLTPVQQTALATIEESFTDNPGKPVLLHGVAGSGKTHLYIHLMREALAAGRQVLYLLPEIALTTQLVERVQRELGEPLAVYHSRYSDAERVEIWQKLLAGRVRAVLGVRSALLLPFTDLGMIVVDEEHDPSYKQTDVSPRYHARDVAVYYGAAHGCPVVLGSATPSLESYYNAKEGRYTLVQLHARVGTAHPPQVQYVDLRHQAQHQLGHGPFSDVALEALRETLAKGEQAIVFKNRRGYSPLLVCDNCGHVPRCPNCDVGLTYHKKNNALRCHHCGYADDHVQRCARCGHTELNREGMGTERLEEQLQEVLPTARIARLDADTTRGRQALHTLLARFAKQEYDILVGTQMVTKGLDFGNVTLGLVVHADAMLNYPDLRAQENAYQQLVQFIGRSGRSNKAGLVLVQTRQPDHPILQLLEQPYEDFYTRELELRRVQAYPPFSRLIGIEVRHKDMTSVQTQAQYLGRQLRARFGEAVLGPDFPHLARLRGWYRQQMLIKIARGVNAQALRGKLIEVLHAYEEQAKGVRLAVDVDPR